ncbi:YdcF family protein [Mucilaginibacter gotjawali]|uniref:Uncharacterized SAM-binding protein YcdF (DUF218 family) n=2 Tax=Mucilaginibacter gotjawali TaxID=1550579 RepID=A0A839SJQ2_9SPHI|nr:YdcF family protein [Mucilaginibacter gotjawali]MBB3057672.1 uncharacterized SAM-binding protein YcdF (DUF218 family) [Mucilaginibacter gotjawali]BAU55335.1 hypothetical protein MgSA37_03517 [Mucilaginibacter gotjawali]
MFFFFSKILEFFIYPLTWILALLIAGIIVKKQARKKWLFIAATALLLIFSNDFLFNEFARSWDVQPAPLTNTTYSCAIVLGGFSSEGKNKQAFFNISSDRFIQGLKLITTGKVSHLLITGGNGGLIHDSFEESDWVKTQLKTFKVPDSCILVEDRSRNTIENAAFTKPILLKAHLKPPYLLVTSGFHMRRSLGIFKKEDIPVIPYPCNYLGGQGNPSPVDIVPDAYVFGLWNYYAKEVVGTMVNKLR